MNFRNESVDETTINVGQKIRMLRERSNLSQRALSEACGLSRNTLSLLERGQTSPTINTLKRIALALGVNINAFFDPFEQFNIVHMKSDQRLHLKLSQGLMTDLGAGMVDQLMTPFILHLEPGARSGPPLSHEGQDFIYCLSGEVIYTINGQIFVLESEDSLFFEGHLPHSFQNTGDEIAKVLIILSTPRDSAEYVSSHFPKGLVPDD